MSEFSQEVPEADKVNTPGGVPLVELPSGTRAVVRALRAGRELAGRLSAMGLVAGAPVEVLQNRGRGPLLILVRDTRVALGRGEALRIVVEALP